MSEVSLFCSSQVAGDDLFASLEMAPGRALRKIVGLSADGMVYIVQPSGSLLILRKEIPIFASSLQSSYLTLYLRISLLLP